MKKLVLAAWRWLRCWFTKGRIACPSCMRSRIALAPQGRIALEVEKAMTSTQLPDPGQFTCAHQKQGHLRCPVPSCPGGVMGKRMRVLVIADNGKDKAHVLFRRVRVGDTWGWSAEP